MGKVKGSDPHIWQIGPTNNPTSNSGPGVIQIIEERENPLWQINLVKPKKMPKGLRLHKGTCYICNESSEQLITDIMKYHPFVETDAQEDTCLDCYIWKNRQAAYKNQIVLVIGKYCYYVGNEATTYSKRGFGGRKFKLRFRNGQTLITTNLVPLGKVPSRLLTKMPNNANFV